MTLLLQSVGTPLWVPGLAFGHGLGGAKDLPVPAPLAIAGGTAALVVSFCVLALAWRRPRYDGQDRVLGRPALLSVFDSPGWQWTWRLLGLLFFGYVTWALVSGPDLVTNPTFGVFYVLVWVGLVPLSLLFGRVVRALSPVRTLNLLLAKVTGGDPSRGLRDYPERLGYWPAALLLFAFVWQELVNPESAYLAPVRLWLAVYLAVMLIGGAIFGDTWFERADPFEVYSNLLAKLSIWGQDEDGTRSLRSPLANLATVVPRPGLLALVAVLFGSTAFDSYKDTLRWINFVDRIDVDRVLLDTTALVVFCLVIGLSFTLAAMTTGVDPADPSGSSPGGTGVRRTALPGLLAHSVLPIIVGYMTAHYLSYFVEQGQTTLIQLSDPMVNGANLLGTADLSVNYFLSYHPTLLASTKVVAVVCGHIVGVMAAHDRAIRLLPARHHVTGQLGMLLIMVAYTATGLYLLFGA